MEKYERDRKGKLKTQIGKDGKEFLIPMENEKEDRIEEIEKRIEVLGNNENVDEYDDMLDEVGINPSVYPASMVLKNVDEIAYLCGFNDYNDEELSELQNELEELKELEGGDKNDD